VVVNTNVGTSIGDWIFSNSEECHLEGQMYRCVNFLKKPSEDSRSKTFLRIVYCISGMDDARYFLHYETKCGLFCRIRALVRVLFSSLLRRSWKLDDKERKLHLLCARKGIIMDDSPISSGSLSQTDMSELEKLAGGERFSTEGSNVLLSLLIRLSLLANNASNDAAQNSCVMVPSTLPLLSSHANAYGAC